MKFTIERQHLLAAMTRVSGASGKSTIATLNHVLILAGPAGVTFTTTNLDMEQRTTVPAQVVEEGSTLVLTSTLFDIAKNMAQGAQASFTLSDDDPRASLVSGRSRFKLPVMPAQDFPVMPPIEGGVVLDIKAEQLAAMLDQVAFCATTEEAMFVMTGTHLFMHEGRISAVATNRFKFGLSHLDDETEIPPVTLPARFVAEAVRVLDGAEAVGLTISSGRVRLIVGDTMIMSKTISEPAPNYIGAMAGATGTNAVAVDVELLQGALRRTLVMASNKERSIRLAFTAGSLAVFARADTNGEAADEIDIDYDGPDVTVTLNGVWLGEILGHIGTEAVQFRMKDGKTPVALSATGSVRASYVMGTQRG